MTWAETMARDAHAAALGEALATLAYVVILFGAVLVLLAIVAHGEHAEK